MKKATTRNSASASARPRPAGSRRYSIPASPIASTANSSADRMRGPPAAQPAGTGLPETSTTASPPSATDPAMPVENRPA
jgi:hypothetical protein